MARTLIVLLALVLVLGAAPLAAQLPQLEEFDGPYAKWLENDHLPVGRPMTTGADPVVLATGNLFVQETDLVIPGRGMDLVIGRSYRSGAADDTRLGRRWTLNLFESLTIAFSEKSWYFYNGALHEIPPATGVQDLQTFTAFAHTGTFYRNGQLRIDNFRGGVNSTDQMLASPLGIFATLKYTGDFSPTFSGSNGLIVGFDTPLTFELRGHDGTIRTFIYLDGDLEEHNAKVYRIATIVDRFGNRQEFHYSPNAQPSPLGYPTKRLEYVLDTYGRRVDLEYDEDGWLWKVRDFDGREVIYGHDDLGNLTSVRSPLAVHSGKPNTAAVGRTTTYRYGAEQSDLEHSILEVLDGEESPGGFEYLTNFYDESGERIFKQHFGGTNSTGVPAGGTWAFKNEQASAPLVNPTNPYPPAHFDVTTPPPQDWTGPSGVTIVEASRSLQIDANGNAKLLIMDKDGSERLTILFTGRLAPEQVTTSQAIKDLVNINYGNPALCSLANPVEQPLHPGSPPCYVTERTFNAHGQVTEELGPASLVRYAYNSASTDACQRGNLLRKDVIEYPATNPKYQTTLFAYEPLYNQVRAVVDPRGTSVLGGAQEPFTPHDVATAVTLARYRHTTTFDYQEQDVTAAGPLQAFAAYWNIDLTQAKQHDFLDQVGWSDSAIVHHDGLGDVNGDGLVSQWMGNAIREQEPDAQVPQSIGVANLTYTNQSSHTLAAFNAHGFPLWSKDEFGKQTSFEYWSGQDPQGDGTTITLNPADAYTPYTLTGDVGGSGQGFLKKTILPHSVETSFKYDTHGNVAETKDPRDEVWKTTWNALGEKLLTEDPRGYKTRWTYDLNGSLIEEESQHLTPDFDGDEYPTGSESPAPTGEWTSSVFEYDLKNQLVEERHRANFKKDAGSPLVERTITTRYRYDKVGNRVLTITPEAVAGNQSANVIVSIFDERGLIFSESRGGAPADWSGMLAHNHIAESVPTTGAIATTRTDYHPTGKPALITDPEGNATTIEYDGFLRLSKSTDPANNCVTSVWDCVGQLLETKQWEGSVAANALLTYSKTKYDERGRAFQVDRLRAALVVGVNVSDGPLTPSDGFVTSRVLYDEKGRAIETVDDNGVVTFSQFDELDRCFHTEDAHGNATAVTFNKASQPIRTTTAEKNEATGQISSFYTWAFYDELGRSTATVSSTGRAVRTTYDSLGRVVATSDPEGPTSGGATLASLDTQGDHTGLPGLVINSPGNSTRQHYDEVGRLILSVQHLRIDGQGGNPLASSQSGDGRITIESTYDLNSRLIAQKDDAGNATTHEYDALNRQWKTTSADGTVVTRAFNMAGHVTSSTDANGSVTSFTLDDVYRVTAKTVQRASGIVGTTFESFSYDGMGRVTSASDDDSTITRAYDTLGNLLRETQPGVTIHFEYDGLGLLEKTTYPGGRVVERAHDSLNRLETVRDAGAATIASYVYEGSRVVERKNLLTGKSWVLDYDAERRVVGTTTRPTGGGTAIDQRTYSHDRRSNKIQRVDALTGLNQAFAYDSASRMLRSEWTPLGGPMVPTAYALDGVGNRGSVSVGALGTQYTLSGPDLPVNQYSLVGSQAREYDANGNLVSRSGNSGPGGGGTGSATATYDYRNQMVSWYDAGTGMVATYGYDCLGRRLSKTVGGTTTQYVWAGQQVIEERIGGALQASYVHGLGLDEILNWRAGTTDRYFATDDMGSVVKLLDATGAAVESYEYGDFGRLLDGATLQPLAGSGGSSGSSAGNRWFYTGREHDWESGLHQHRMRYMEPGVGRFTTRDPIGIWGDASNAGNGYTYAASNPWTWCDPTGLEKVNYCPGDGPWRPEWFDLLALAPYLGPGWRAFLEVLGLMALNRADWYADSSSAFSGQAWVGGGICVDQHAEFSGSSTSTKPFGFPSGTGQDPLPAPPKPGTEGGDPNPVDEWFTIGYWLDRDGKYRAQYNEFCQFISRSWLPERWARNVRELAKKATRQRLSPIGKAATTAFVRTRNAIGLRTSTRAGVGTLPGRPSSVGRTNKWVNSAGGIGRYAGKGLMGVGIGIEVNNVINAPPGEGANEAFRGACRLGFAAAGGVAGGTLGAAAPMVVGGPVGEVAAPITGAAGALIGAGIGSEAGENFANQVLKCIGAKTSGSQDAGGA